MLFVQLEAAKREKFPPETTRQWFIQFIKAGWTKEIISMKVELLMKVKVYGIEKLEIADWINAEEKVVTNKNAYDPYKPLPDITEKERLNTSQILKNCIAEIDAKMREKNKRTLKTGLPATYRADFLAKCRAAERIKKSHRTQQTKR